MKIKLKYKTDKGIIRLENSVDIKELLMNEDFLHPDEESVAIGFTNNDSSGLIEFTPKELHGILNDFNKKKHLIKGIKILKGQGI